MTPLVAEPPPQRSSEGPCLPSGEPHVSHDGSAGGLRRLLSRSALSVVDQAVFSGTTFVTMVLVGRCCPQASVGVYALAMSAVFLLRGIQEHTIGAPFQVFRSRCRNEQSAAAYTGSTFVAQLLLTAAFLLVGVVGWTCWNGNLPSGDATLIVWPLFVVVPFVLLREFARQVAFARLKPGGALAVDATTAAVQLGGLAVLAGLGSLTIVHALWVMVAANVAAAGGWYLLSCKQFRFRSSQFRSDWGRNWRFGRWALGGYLLGSTAPYLMPWLLAASHGASETGQFAVCATFIGLAGMFVLGVSHYLTPQAAASFSSGGPRELTRLLQRTALLYLMTLGAFLVLVAGAGESIVVLVWGAGYAGLAAPLTLLAANVLVNGFGVTAGNGLWAINQPRANVVADVCALAAMLLAAAAFVPTWGVTGAALSALVGTTAGTIIRFLILRRCLSTLQVKPAV